MIWIDSRGEESSQCRIFEYARNQSYSRTENEYTQISQMEPLNSKQDVFGQLLIETRVFECLVSGIRPLNQDEQSKCFRKSLKFYRQEYIDIDINFNSSTPTLWYIINAPKIPFLSICSQIRRGCLISIWLWPRTNLRFRTYHWLFSLDRATLLDF
jgi:hypothetical protein